MSKRYSHLFIASVYCIHDFLAAFKALNRLSLYQTLRYIFTRRISSKIEKVIDQQTSPGGQIDASLMDQHMATMLILTVIAIFGDFP